MCDIQKIMATATTATATATTASALASSIPTMYIMVGPAGSGKSTRALQLAGSIDNIASADLFNTYVDGIIDFSRIPEAHMLCQERAHNLMKEGALKVVIDNTNLEPKYLLPYFESAEELGYRVEWVLPNNGILHFSDPKLRSQIDRENHCVRVRRSGEKIVPEQIVRTMATNTIGLAQRIIASRRVYGDDPAMWKQFCIPQQLSATDTIPTSGKYGKSGKKKGAGGRR